MIQCKDCEFFDRGPDGSAILRCDAFTTIKEPECLQKLQCVRLHELVRAYQATVAIYQRLAPLQEKMMKMMEHEIDEIDDADSWKFGCDDDDEDDEYPDDEPN